MKTQLSIIYVSVVALISLATLVYVYSVPLDSMYETRDGAPHFSPPVINPDTGEPIELGRLIRHYRGD
ncbi:MAG: hypothetical protein KTR32_42025 [Granulosicoccus sp.]|nr:hypothetical protein [Granulosicoccus sp.]